MWNKPAFGALWLLAAPAFAQVTPLIFERETIRIESPAQKSAASNHAPLSYEVEIRPEDALRLEYIHTLNELTDKMGVMIAFAAPSVVSLPAYQVSTPVDALFISDNGTVTQILPNTVLAEMNQEIVAPMPVKAFLFLKAGTVAAQGIRPQDVVVGKKFVPAPPVMK